MQNDSVEATKYALDALLRRNGATTRAVGHDDAQGRAIVMFAVGGRNVRIQVPMPRSSDWPDPNSHSWFAKHDCPAEWNRWSVHQRCEWVDEQLRRKVCERWASILAIVAAKFEWIAIGASTLEREFLADVAMPDGQTVGEWVVPALKAGRAPQPPPRAAPDFSAQPAQLVQSTAEWVPPTAMVKVGTR